MICCAQVDLAEILAGYIDNLQTVTVSFEGCETTINFAQAALVLQGTASVYCKKVDFLWQVSDLIVSRLAVLIRIMFLDTVARLYPVAQLLTKMIDLLHSKKGGEEGEEGGEEGGGGAGRSRKRRNVDMTAELTELEAIVAKNIDIKVVFTFIGNTL